MSTTQPTCVLDLEDNDYHLHVQPTPEQAERVTVTALFGDHEDVETHVAVDVNRGALVRALLPAEVRDYLLALLDVDACARDEEEQVGSYTPATRASAWDLLSLPVEDAAR